MASSRNLSKFQLAPVAMATLVAVGIFLWGWGEQISLWTADSQEVGITIGPECGRATGVRGGRSLDEIFSAPQVFSPIKVPLRLNEKKIRTQAGSYQAIRCRVDLSELSGSDLPVMALGRLFGKTRVWVDGTPRIDVFDNGHGEFPLLAGDRKAGLEVVIISLPTGAGHAGPATRRKLAVFPDSESLLQRQHAVWFEKTQLPMFLLAFTLGLLLVFVPLWVMGVRYEDVGWMVISLTLLAGEAVLYYRPVTGWDNLASSTADVLRFSITMSLVVFLCRFFRLPRKVVSPESLALLLAAAYAVMVFTVPSSVRNSWNLSMMLPCYVGGALFLVVAREGFLTAAGLDGGRRRRVRMFAGFAAIGGIALIMQGLFHKTSGLVSVRLVSYGTTMLFGGFLAADLVVFHREYFKEKAARLKESQDKVQLRSQVELGRSVQSLILPREREGKVGPLVFGFRFEPAAQLSGGWFFHWRGGGGETHLLIGDVVGRGPQAALSVAAIVSRLRTCADQGVNLLASITLLHEHLVKLFDRHVATTLTGVTLRPDASAELVSFGGNGWIKVRGGTPEHWQGVGTSLGSRPELEVRSESWDFQPGDLLVASTAGIIPDKRSLAAYTDTFEGTKAASGDFDAYYQNAVVMGQKGAAEDAAEEDKTMLFIGRNPA